MRYALTIQCDTAAELEAVAAYLARMPAAEKEYDPARPLCKKCNGIGRLCRPDGNPTCDACGGSGNAPAAAAVTNTVTPSPPKPSEVVLAPPPKPANGAAHGPATASELMAWINAQRDKDDARRRVQTTGKKLGFGWRYQQFKPDQVAAVVHAMREHEHRGQMGAKT